MQFTDFDFDQKLLDIISAVGFESCTEVQAETFQHSLNQKDLCVQSQTGTGKTAAFLISIYQLFLSNKTKTRKALILVPTRELAIQIEEEANRLKGNLGFSVASIFGGVGYGKQEQQLKEGIDILIGTPGRLIDFMKSGKLIINDISFLVLDEADRMLDMGFYPDIREILKKAPPKEKRQTMLFSATLRTKVKNLAWKFMNEPEEVSIEPESITVTKITQELYHVSKEEKIPILLGILKREKPENMLIFTNTKHGAIELTKRLRTNGIDSQYIMGDLPQKKRIKIINDLKEGRIACLVATDVAARGLHVDDLDLVVNYDLPEDCENYVHRIGRTARAGKSGKAISLACEKYVFGLESIEKYINMKIPVAWADETLFAEDKSAGMSFHQPRRDGRGRDNRSRDSRNRDNRHRNSRSSGGRNQGGRYQKSSQHQAKSGGPPKSAQQNAGRKSASGQTRQDRQNRPNRQHTPNRQNKQNWQKNRPSDHKNRKPGTGRTDKKSASAKNRNINDRLEMYKQKYGEDFTVKEHSKKSNKEKKSLIKTFIGRLRKKKK